MSNNENMLKIQNVLDSAKYGEEHRGFPVHTKEPSEKGKVRAAFGLEAQGKQSFVERAISDGVGWSEIGNAIGWIGFAVFGSYYQSLYGSLFEEKGLLMVDVNEDQRKGWVQFNPKTNEIFVANETIEEPSDNPFKSLEDKIKRVQFLIRDKELFKNTEMKLPDFYMKESSPFKSQCFHTSIQKGDEIETIRFDSLNFTNLILTLLNKQEDGFTRITSIFFDSENIHNNEKASVPESDLKGYFEIGLNKLNQE